MSAADTALRPGAHERGVVRRRRLASSFFRVVSGATIAAIVATLLVGVELATAPTPATAASASGWDPGFIIDDSIFYDSTSMTAGEVQAFLNSQGRQCQSGYTCLTNYGVPTETRGADRYCGAYQGAAYQTAAQIIDAVARACGINQRVLLVLLQKEQSLVTSTAPSARAYSAATGMSCPDTAGCDPQYAGFFYQVYFAARQYQIYRLNPTIFGYQAQRWNTIQFHPNAACGTQRIFINNQATAGLYIYTPYTPNGAAINNLYGTGDACSSYGNRNFWRIFTDWFGDPKQYTVANGYQWYWDARGGPSGEMGNPISYLVYTEENGGGWYQRFQGGTVYTGNLGTTAFVFNNVFSTAYNVNYGPIGSLGWPTSEQMCATNGVCYQSFMGGTITTAAGVGTHVLPGGIAQQWKQSGGPYALGAATGPSEYQQANGVGWIQHFQTGSVVVSGSGTFVVPRNSLGDIWISSGTGRGGYGWPTSTYTCVNASCAQSFQGGVLSATASNGAHAIMWGFESYWRQSGGLNDLGAALTDLRRSNARGGGWVQQFGAAALSQRADGTMTRIPYGGIWTEWARSGAEAGTNGWPMAAAVCAGGACGQRFETAVITTSPSGTNAVVGGFTGAWQTFGGIATVGAATGPLRFMNANGGGWLQQFSGGVITQTVSGSPVFTPSSAILTTWLYYGAERTWLGWPLAAPQCSDSDCAQEFQHALAYSNAGGVRFDSK